MCAHGGVRAPAGKNTVSPLHCLPPFVCATKEEEGAAEVLPQHVVSEPSWPEAVEHGHAMRAGSAAAAADLRGGAQRLRWRGVARRRGGEAIRAAGEAARAATLLASGRGMWVSRGHADHRRRKHPAERRTAVSIMSVRDRVREPGRAGRVSAWQRRRRRAASPGVAASTGGCADLRAVCRPMEVCSAAAPLADTEAVRGVVGRWRSWPSDGNDGSCSVNSDKGERAASHCPPRDGRGRAMSPVMVQREGKSRLGGVC
nr:uncharacterized protein LOC127307414 [Lolium perenne]